MTEPLPQKSSECALPDLWITRPSIEHFTFHKQYKHSGTFANLTYEELSYPKNQKMSDPIIVTPVVKM